jgi:hypothetical protein
MAVFVVARCVCVALGVCIVLCCYVAGSYPIFFLLWNEAQLSCVFEKKKT